MKNRKEIIDQVQAVLVNENDKPVYSKKELALIIKTYEEEIMNALSDGDDVALTNFVKFTIADVPAKSGQNYLTGGTWSKPATKVVKVKAFNKLKEAARTDVD